MGDEQKNFLAVLALCGLVFFGGDFLIQKWRGPKDSSPVVSQVEKTPAALGEKKLSIDEDLISFPSGLSREEALLGPRVQIQSSLLKGSINLEGAQIDDLRLLQYQETTQPQSPDIILLSPQGTENSYSASFFWESKTREVFPLPQEKTLWKADRDLLTPESPVTLSWDNGQGLLFQQVIFLDENYLFTVTHRVINQTEKTFHLGLSGRLLRSDPKNLAGNFLLYEGPLGTFGGSFQEISYDQIKEKGLIRLNPTETGWLGITDKYWLVAFMPEEQMVPFFQRIPQADPLMLVGYRGDFQTLNPHETLETKSNLFAGAKILSLLDAYEKTQKADHFDLAVDFGWFYFLTKPIFYALTWLKDLTGNFGLAILLFTVLLKLLFFPLANKSYHAMARMKRFQPMMEEIRTRYKDDPARLNQETMNFYKKNKINPVSGCLPMLLQIPAFFALYKVLFISIEMRHAPFLGWIHDLSAPDPTNFFTLFGLIPWTPPTFLHLGIWPFFMGCSMVLQQKLNPPPVDPIQRKMFQYVMPLVFTFMLGQFASGLVIYWTWNNLLSVLQQWLIMRSDLKKIEPGVKQSKKLS